MNQQVTTISPDQRQRKSVLITMADRYGMEPDAFQATVAATCMPAKQQVTKEQFAAFLLVAKEYNLNPILKEIYAFPTRGGGIQPIVGVDGWANLINSQPQCDGIEFDDHLDEQGNLTAITCRIYRKDRSRPTTATEYMAECRRDTDTWKQWPRRMLRHKALIQAARYAFGFSGIADPDEWERSPEGGAGIRDITPPPAPAVPSAPSAPSTPEQPTDDRKEVMPNEPGPTPQPNATRPAADDPATEQPPAEAGAQLGGNHPEGSTDAGETGGAQPERESAEAQPQGTASEQPADDASEMPDPDKILDDLEAQLATASTKDIIDEIYVTQIEPLIDEDKLFPPDKQRAVDMYKKHIKRVEG